MSQSRLSQLMTQPEARLAVIAVVVFVVMSALSPDRFLSVQNLTSMAFQFPEFAILALAMTMTMLTGGIDLSVVGIANLSAIVAATILTRLAGPGRRAAARCCGWRWRCRYRLPSGWRRALQRRARSPSSACRRSSPRWARG